MRIRATDKRALLLPLLLSLTGPAPGAANPAGHATAGGIVREQGAQQSAGDPGEDLVIDTFDQYPSGVFPQRWSFMSGTSIKDAGEAERHHVPATVREEGGNRFLELSEHDDAHTLLLRGSWNLRQHPCVSWRWRVTRFPDGANERVDGSKDTAASLYVIFKIKKFLGITKGMVGIRYLWSNELPVGDWMERRGSERLVVVQSGTRTGEWRRQTINVLDSYAALYPGDKLPKEVIALGLRTDANSTGTAAVAQYDDLKLMAQCPGVEGAGASAASGALDGGYLRAPLH